MAAKKPSKTKERGKRKSARKAPGREVKKNAKKQNAKKKPKVDKKVVEFRKALMEPAEKAMISYFLYPVAKKRKEKEAAKEVIKEAYSKGDVVVKQFILFLAHEQLAKAAGIKTMHNFSHYRKSLPKESEMGEVRKAVYRTIFNYTTSYEGIVELLGLLGELGDETAAKLITYHLSYYSSMEAPVLQIFRNASLEALGACSCPYALEALINYAKYGEKTDRAVLALSRWSKKLEATNMGAEEKAYYEKEIKKLLGGKGGHEYYR
ncbi:hypothetical protein GF415_02715 [Candidatus Micrarchaeota archaeon]|nr:hypothetical protein [Candidatus Micrarchaeota archaeon]